MSEKNSYWDISTLLLRSFFAFPVSNFFVQHIKSRTYLVLDIILASQLKKIAIFLVKRCSEGYFYSSVNIKIYTA